MKRSQPRGQEWPAARRRSRALRAALAAPLLASCLLLAACGESEEQKAISKVCDTRKEIGKHVKQISNTELSASTAPELKQDVKELKEEIHTLHEEVKKIKGQKQFLLAEANENLKLRVEAIATELQKGASLSSAHEQLKAAVNELGASYQEALKAIECP
jgi:hypothetical protein